MRQKWVLNIVLILVSTLVTYAILEAGFRWHAARQMMRTPLASWTTSAPLHEFDELTGYNYIPNQEMTFTRYRDQETVAYSHTLYVNNLGHISRNDDSLEKPENVYRIAILGDSFTSGTTSPVPWADFLEEKLNADTDLLQLLEVEAFDTVNFGRDGIGVVQFGQIFQRALTYDPDMVLVNVIDDDVSRKLVWVDTLDIADSYDVSFMCSTPAITVRGSSCAPYTFVFPTENTQELYADFLVTYRAQTIGMSLRPNLLFGFVGLETDIRMPGERSLPRFDTIADGVEASVNTLREMQTQHPNVLITHNPYVLEIMTLENNDERGTQLLEQMPEIIRMAEYIHTPDENTVAGWFNTADGHWTETGSERYADAMHDMLRERLLP